MGLSKEQLDYEKQLLSTLKHHQGPGLKADNYGKANNATTYRNEFCIAACELIRLYESASIFDHIGRMSSKFQDFDIKTCRGYLMTRKKAEYFYYTHLVERIKSHS